MSLVPNEGLPCDREGNSRGMAGWGKTYLPELLISGPYVRRGLT